MDLELVVRLQVAHVLWRNEDELSMIHLLGYRDECLHGNLTGNRIEEDVEFVHDAEGGLEGFANGKQEGEGGERAFASA